jgi:outer membrane biosynthesis protein TonB
MRSMIPGLLTVIVFITQSQAADPISPKDLDSKSVEILKEVHNRGALLYNSGDALSCHRMYESALTTVKPFLDHHPKIQIMIDEGLADIASADGVRLQAFKGHELIEKVRSALKDEIAKVEANPKPKDAPKPPTEPMPKPPTEPKTPTDPKPKTPTDPKPKVVDPPKPKANDGEVSGIVTIDGKPLSNASLMFVSTTLAEPRVFTAETTATGAYQIRGPLPADEYLVSVQGKNVPAKFQTLEISGLKLRLTDQLSNFNLDLKSK